MHQHRSHRSTSLTPTLLTVNSHVSTFLFTTTTTTITVFFRVLILESIVSDTQPHTRKTTVSFFIRLSESEPQLENTISICHFFNESIRNGTPTNVSSLKENTTPAERVCQNRFRRKTGEERLLFTDYQSSQPTQLQLQLPVTVTGQSRFLLYVCSSSFHRQVVWFF